MLGCGWGVQVALGLNLSYSLCAAVATPLSADAVLIIDPRTNASDFFTLSTLHLATGTHKWVGIAYAPSTERLYAAPSLTPSVLVISPSFNSTAALAVDGYGWGGIAYADVTGTRL